MTDPTPRRRSLLAFLVTVIIFTGLDLGTKEWVFDALKSVPGQQRDVWEGVFRLKLVRNPGMMWGLYQDVKPWAWIAIRGGVLVALIFFFISLKTRSFWAQVAFGLVTAGAIGNVADNIIHGEVRDFLDFYWFEFPTFNIADSCICVGAPLLLVLLWNHDRRDAIAPG